MVLTVFIAGAFLPLAPMAWLYVSAVDLVTSPAAGGKSARRWVTMAVVALVWFLVGMMVVFGGLKLLGFPDRLPD